MHLLGSPFPEVGGDPWWHHPYAPHRLQPGSPVQHHLDTAEYDLPPGAIAPAVDLRNGPFGLSTGVRIESRTELLGEHRERVGHLLVVCIPITQGLLQ